MKNKLINILYRGGAGGEFFGGLLTSHKEVVEKNTYYNKSVERWILPRDDWESFRTWVVTSKNPRKDVFYRRPNWEPDEELWNVRLDHGYGFMRHTEFWIDYLWNDWKETRTIIFNSSAMESLYYTQKLATLKLGWGPNDADKIIGNEMVIDGILDFKQFWQRPWESNAYYFELFMSMIPDNHDFLLIDPCELLHNNEEDTKRTLREIINYIGLDDYLFDDWVESIENYRIKNKELINTTMINGNPDGN